LTEQSKDKQMELKGSLRELSSDIARLQATQDRQSLLLEEKITDKVSATKKETEETQTELENSLAKLTAYVTRLQATQNRQTLLLYVAIGLLVWLLIKIL
jgi:Skp family chaperone for outer membrane proteins